MHPLAQYVLLGSLIAGAAGALVLVAVTLRHGLNRRDASDSEQAPEVVARRQRVIRLADTVAVLCFAVSAGLGVVGLMQQTRVAAPAVAAADDGAVIERLGALEKLLASAELELQTREGSSPEWRAWEDRIARLENRVGAVENRVAVAQRRTPAVTPRAVIPATNAPRPAAPAKPVAAPPQVEPPPSASPRLAPSFGEASGAPEVAAPPRPDPSVAIVTAPPIPPPAPIAPPAGVAAPGAVVPRPPVPAPVAAAPRAPARSKAEMPREETSLGDKIRRDWHTVKQHARRGGEEWREGWDQLKRLFGY